jgi:hypothetical protein
MFKKDLRSFKGKSLANKRCEQLVEIYGDYTLRKYLIAQRISVGADPPAGGWHGGFKYPHKKAPQVACEAFYILSGWG